MELGIKKLAMDLCVFYHTGAGSEKSFCSIKLCFYQRGIQPNISFIFWGTGRSIEDFDKQAYGYYVFLFLKIYTWANRRVLLEWENTHMRQISADHRTKDDVSKAELLILHDNLDGQVQKNANICVRREITPFAGIAVLSTHMTWILLTQDQEIRSGLVL